MKALALVAWRVALVCGLAALAFVRGPEARDGSHDRVREAGVLYTSPTCDGIIGYAGPSDCAITLDAVGRIQSVELLSSGDTVEHVAAVREDPEFFAQFRGLDPSDANAFAELDGVSRATLTSFAILEAVGRRVAGRRVSLRFPEPIGIDEVRAVLPAAHTLGSSGSVSDGLGVGLGSVLRTGPGGEAVVGYQGPTDTLVVADAQGVIRGIALRKSYDNERYVGYVRDDVVFAEQFVGKTMIEVAGLLEGDSFDPHEQLDGVSGATMTSHAVGEGIVRTVARHLAAPPPIRASAPVLRASDVGTLIAVALALALTFSRWRGGRRLRLVTRLAIVLYLGVLAGAMLSQDLLVGWATNGLPWRGAPGLVVLAATALLIPATTGRQTYCHQLCPHGALQELLRRTPWQRPVPRRAYRVLRYLPGACLAVIAGAVAWGLLGFPYAALEPFGAWAFPLAGVATCVLAVVGLGASAVYGMAYCRMGCPTGALLDFVRRRNADRWRLRDSVATVVAGVALLRSMFGV